MVVICQTYFIIMHIRSKVALRDKIIKLIELYETALK